jgi:hypothetical protein
MFRDDFLFQKYDDAPFLSDQLLLPALAKGFDVHVVASFTPSYMFRLLEDLADSPEIEPGLLNLVFCMPFTAGFGSNPAKVFRDYLSAFALDDAQVLDFAANALELFSEGSLRFSAVVSKTAKDFAKGTLGAITNVADEDPDYFTFVDAKGGDYNSPVVPQRSWIESEANSAEQMLEVVLDSNSDSIDGFAKISETRVRGWFQEIVTGTSEKESSQSANLTPDLEEELDEFEQFIESAERLDEDSIEFLEYDELFDFELPQESQETSVSVHDAQDGHIPPLPMSIAGLVGPAWATCVCGAKFMRADGCPHGFWE